MANITLDEALKLFWGYHNISDTTATEFVNFVFENANSGNFETITVSGSSILQGQTVIGTAYSDDALMKFANDGNIFLKVTNGATGGKLLLANNNRTSEIGIGCGDGHADSSLVLQIAGEKIGFFGNDGAVQQTITANDPTDLATAIAQIQLLKEMLNAYNLIGLT